MNEYSDIVGFNYHPSYAWNSYETWRFFDEETIRREITLGKKLFPKMNTLRLWLSFDAFLYEEERQAENFEKALQICAQNGCKAVPVLFNNWHDRTMDNGGIYLPMIIPGSMDRTAEDTSDSLHSFDSYIAKIVAPHADDPRILLWDICNEVYQYGGSQTYRDFAEPYETEWLRKMYHACKDAGARQPVATSYCAPCMADLERTAEFVDVFLIHPYYYGKDSDLETKPSEGFDELLGQFLAMGEKYHKPVLTTETCWGSRSDQARAEIIRRTLTAHKKAGIGYIAHALYYSHVADLHDEGDGPFGKPGNLCFITKDGKIRPGHEVFNEF